MIALFSHKYYYHLDGKVFCRPNRSGPVFELQASEEQTLQPLFKAHIMRVFKLLTFGFVISILGLLGLGSYMLDRSMMTVAVIGAAAILILAPLSLFKIISLNTELRAELKAYFAGRPAIEFRQLQEKLQAKSRMIESPARFLYFLLFGLGWLAYGVFVLLGAVAKGFELLSIINLGFALFAGSIFTGLGFIGLLKRN